MLRALHIRDFVIVDRADIEFDDGFTVFTGETGAGKSILVDALALALGERADLSVLREGATKAEISAVFAPTDDIQRWLEEHDLQTEDELVLRRVVDAQGRSRGYINGSPVNLAQLKEVGEKLIDIHGQHAHQSLLRNDSQRDLLDAHGSHQPLKQNTLQAWKSWRVVQKKLEAATQDASSLAAAQEKLDWQISELQSLRLVAGEWDEISTEHTRLAHAQALIDGASNTLAMLDEAESSAQHVLAVAVKTIGTLVKHDVTLQAVHDALVSASTDVNQAISDLNIYLSGVELDPARLSVVEARMSSLFDAARKLKTDPEHLFTLLQSLLAERDALMASTNVEALEQEASELKRVYETAARALSAARRESATLLSQEVTAAMQTLAMQGGSFQIAVTDTNPSGQGQDQIEFLVAGHAGTTPRPLAKVVSGGELARISLALSVIASRAARVPTLIFDEVDSGIGGAVAEVVGRLLAELGNRHQVLCVTHLPQVAARGQHQFQVSKRQIDQTTVSTIERLQPSTRIEEIARMLGGVKITETTREHAKELLAG